jgi:hypothetical protein
MGFAPCFAVADHRRRAYIWGAEAIKPGRHRTMTMTDFRDTNTAAEFIASGDSRETSPEIMQAIAFFARNAAEAEALWNGDGFGVVCHPIDLWEHVTKNGMRDPSEFCWGSAGTHWWDSLSSPVEG